MANDMISDLLIETYNHKGHGIGYFGDKKVEVVGTAKGDHAAVRLLSKKKGAYRSQLLEIITASNHRQEVRCKHVGSCGGCALQQVSYEQQLEIKQTKIEELFSFVQTGKILPIVPCINQYEYRNKMEYTFSQDKEGKRYLGLMIARSRGKVLHLEECALTAPWFMAAKELVYQWWQESEYEAYYHYRDQGTLQNLILRYGMRTNQKMCILVVSGNSKYAIQKQDLDRLIQKLQKEIDPYISIYLKIKQIAKKTPTQYYEIPLAGPEAIEEKLEIFGNTFTFKVSPSSFFQPNTYQAEKLYEQMLKLISINKETIVFDLYAGTATIGILVAPFVKKVLAIESNPYAVFDAKENLEKNYISNLEIFKGEVKEVLTQIEDKPDLVIVDPPRGGLEKSLETILQFHPKHILYISCNPHTQAADLKKCLQAGYHVIAIQPVDQFPHTPHIENMIYLGLSEE